MKKKLKLFGNRILTKQVPFEEKTIAGLILVDANKHSQERFEIISIGTGSLDKNGDLIPIPVKVGDVILIEKYTGQKIALDGEEFTILRAEDMVAIVEK